MSNYLEKWRSAADDFIAVLLVKADAWQRAIADYGVGLEDVPEGAWRKVYKAAIDLRTERIKTPGAPTILGDVETAAKCDSGVSVEWVAERLALWDEYRERQFETTCKLMTTFARGNRQLQETQRGAARLRAALDSGQTTDEAVDVLVDGLRQERATKTVQAVDIADISAEIEPRFNEDPDPGIETGVWLFDRWLRGLSPGEFLAWIAPYKSRKTSVMACILLNMARSTRSIDVFSFDESRARMYYRLMAVLMAEYAWQHGLWDYRAEDGTLLNVFDGKMIRNAGNRWKQWPKPFQLAREYARDELEALRGRIRIYDQQTGAGGMRAIRSICQIDAMKHGLDVVMVDHIQRIPGYQTTYESVEFGSAGLHDVAGELGIVAWVLSQQNEAAIKGQDEGGHTPNAKGGGGIASNADTVIVSKYKTGTVKQPEYLRCECRLAREGDAPVFGYVEIHPASGWITPREVDMRKLTTAAINEADNNPLSEDD